MPLLADRQTWDAFARDNPYYHTVSWDRFRQWDDAAESDYWRSGEDTIHQLLDLLEVPPLPTWTALEIGCGIGRLVHPMARRVARVIGCDLSTEMVEQARTHAADHGITNVCFVNTSGHMLDGIASSSVDLVYSYAVFQHLSDMTLVDGYLLETARVLRPDGVAILHCPTSTARTSVARAARWVRRLGRGDTYAHWYWALRARAEPDQTLREDRAPRMGQRLDDPARRMKSVRLNRFLEWASDAGLQIQRIDRPGETYTTVVLRKPY